MQAVADEGPTTQAMLETMMQMLRHLQSDVSTIKTRLDSVQSDVSAIKLEQTRQARQLDSMAKDLHTFAADLYELRLEFGEFKESMTSGISQSPSARK